MAWVVALFAMNTALLCVVAIREVERPTRALTWLVVGMVLPGIGFLVYLVLSDRPSRRRPGQKRVQTTELKWAPPQSWGKSAASVARLTLKLTGVSPVSSKVGVLTNGNETYKALIFTLQKARESIDVEFYIYRDDHIGRTLTDILLTKAREGVQVRFMVDGWGSRKLPRRVLDGMKSAGIDCRRFFPVRFPWIIPTLNHRDHCKIVVIDRRIAFAGGINVGDEYTGRKPQTGPWRDTHLALTGEAVRQLEKVFEMNWSVATPHPEPANSFQSAPKSKHPSPMSVAKQPSKQPSARSARSDHKSDLRLFNLQFNGEWASEWEQRRPGLEQGETGSQAARQSSEVSHPGPTEKSMEIGHLAPAWVQTVQSGPDSPGQAIEQLFFEALTQAVKSIEVTTPYFVPDTDIISALKNAAYRGVRVRLLLPLQADHRVIAMASRTYFAELVEAGIQIYLYKKGILHAKVMTIDKEVSIVGAANFDLRSFRLNYEVSEVIYSQDVASRLVSRFEKDLENAQLLTHQQLAQETGLQRTLNRGARVLSLML